MSIFGSYDKPANNPVKFIFILDNIVKNMIMKKDIILYLRLFTFCTFIQLLIASLRLLGRLKCRHKDRRVHMCAK